MCIRDSEYTVFAGKAIDPYDFGTPLDQVVASYITAFTPINVQLEGRITRIDTPSTPEPTATETATAAPTEAATPAATPETTPEATPTEMPTTGADPYSQPFITAFLVVALLVGVEVARRFKPG